MKRIKLLTVLLISGVSIGVIGSGLQQMASEPDNRIREGGRTGAALVLLSATLSGYAGTFDNRSDAIRAAAADRRYRLVHGRGMSGYLGLPALWFGHAWESVETPNVNARTLTSPEVAVPKCEAVVCESPTVIGARTITSPGVPSRTVESDSRDVARLCTAIICVGPFTIPSAMIGPTPATKDRSVTSPAVTVAAACTDASLACSGRTVLPERSFVTPSTAAWPLFPSGSMSAGTSPFSGHFEPSDARLAWFEPIVVTAYVPDVGSIPVSLCPNGCAVPMPPNGTLQGSITITLKAGDNERSATIPIDLRW